MSAGPGVAVVGTSFGCRVHVAAFRAAGWEVAVLVGRDPDRTRRRAERLGIPRSTASLDEALALDAVTAVSLATPPATHRPLVLRALDAGRHVLCEKPFALSAGEAAEMRAAAESARLVGLVGHEFRFAEDRALAWREVRSGRIGAPRLALFTSWIPLVASPSARVPAWWWDPQQGGGWLGASGSHLIDQVRWWLGEVGSVSASLGLVSDRSGPPHHRGPSAEDSFSARLEMTDGATCDLQQTAGAWGAGTGAARVAGVAGTVWLDDGEVWLADSSGSRRLPVPADLRLAPAPAASDDPRDRFTHLELGPYTRLAERFADTIAGRPIPVDQPQPATFTDAVSSMEVLDAIRLSAADGGALVRMPA